MWYGDTSETSRQGQFYRAYILAILTSDCCEYEIDTWLNSIWEIYK